MHFIIDEAAVRRPVGGWDVMKDQLRALQEYARRPHITIQNKVSAKEAKALLDELERDFRPRPLAISGLLLHRYRGGPWETLATYKFRGNASSRL